MANGAQQGEQQVAKMEMLSSRAQIRAAARMARLKREFHAGPSKERIAQIYSARVFNTGAEAQDEFCDGLAWQARELVQQELELPKIL